MAYGMHRPEIRIAMQRLGLLGLSYRTADQDAIARAALATPLGEAIRKMHEECAFAESVYLATCNRVEWIFVVPEGADPWERLGGLEQRFGGDGPQLYRLAGDDVARHVFEVAASLDSMNPGETQIVGQVREAYRRSSELGLVGPRLHLLFEAALRAAKRVRRETALTARPVSMMSLALEAAGDLPDGATVAVVGAGVMAVEAAERLAKRPALVRLFANRTFLKADALAARAGGRAIELQGLLAAPPKVDALITAVSVEAPLFDRAALGRLAAAGSPVDGRGVAGPAVIIDLGVPANVDAAAAREFGFRVYGMDDLRAQGEANRRRLEVEIAAARVVLDEELEEFGAAMLERTLAPVLAAWRRRARHTLDEGLARLFTSENGRWNEDERERIERWAASLVDRLTHLPMVGMRQVAAEHGVAAAHTFLAAVGATIEDGEGGAAAPVPGGTRRPEVLTR
jgi:glutamyl-tRNA reductase